MRIYLSISYPDLLPTTEVATIKNGVKAQLPQKSKKDMATHIARAIGGSSLIFLVELISRRKQRTKDQKLEACLRIQNRMAAAY